MAPISFTPSVVGNPQGVQGSYPFRQAAGHEGMIADLQEYVCRTYINQTGGALPIGALVATDNSGGTDPYAVRLASAITLNLGVVVDANVYENASGGAYQSVSGQFPGAIIAADGRPGIPDKHSLNVLHRGVVWVFTPEAVSLGDAVRFYRSNHNGTLAGAFQGRFGRSAVVGVTALFANGARWLSETSGAGLALLELDLVGSTFTAD